MSDHDRRTPANGDDTFDDLFPNARGARAREPDRSPARPDGPPTGYRGSDETHAMARTDQQSARPASAPAAYDGQIGSPPPPRGAGFMLPLLIIGASVLALVVVGFMVLRGRGGTPNTAVSTPVVTRTVTSAPSTGASSTGPSSPTPTAATVPPPGFEKCAGTDIGYKVKGAGTTCPFVADVATQAAQRAPAATDGRFTLQVASTATKQTYSMTCTVGAYIQCTIPSTDGKSSPTYIDVLRG